MRTCRLLAIVFLIAVARQAAAQTTFDASLAGLNEVPPNASPGTGFGVVVLDASQTMITVDESWSGLTAPATLSHIHTGAPGVIGPVTFPFSGVPAATAGAIPEQTFSITAAQVADLLAGNMYMNVHTANFPGGEIRGQLLPVPEPASIALLAAGGFGLLLRRSRRRR